MTTRFKRVCIYGAGAIGGWIGAGLAGAGCQVSMLARGATLAALREHGLRLSQGETTQAFEVTASDQTAGLGVQDLVVLSVKAPAMPDVARHIAPLLGPNTVVLSAMNGVPWWFLDGFGAAHQGKRLESVDPGGALARAIAPGHVIGCVVHASCSLDAPGWVRHNLGNRLIVGEPAGAASARLSELGELLVRGGFEGVLSTSIQRDIWYKLWGNMTMNPISALTGATSDRVLDDPLVRGFASAVMLEAREIGARLGVPIQQEPEERHALTRKLGSIKTSMLQDVEAGKPVELDALLGAARELGQLTGVPTPQIDALFGLARLHARVHGLYPEAAP
jgi:2-dehydropantoate 2-reductase